MRLLVTGGAGYIGSHVATELLHAGHDVVVVDDLSTGHAEAVARVSALTGRPCPLVRADIAALPAGTLAGVDVVLHFAAAKRVPESMARPEAYFRNNLGGTAGLLAAMEEAGVRRLVYSSSAAVYGTQERMPVAEDAPLRPDSPYGLTKRMGEEMCSWMARSRGWAVVSLRYFNPVGAHPSGRIGQPVAEESALVPRALRAILDPSEPLTVFGTDYPTPDGTGLRDFIHVSDLAAGHLLALNALIPGDHRVYNVGTGHPHSVREVLAACRRATGRDVPHVDGARRDGDIPVSTADAARFARDLGFRPTRSLDEMVGSTWRWIERNPRGYAAS